MTIVESLPLIDGVVLVGANDSILFWSRSAEALFGYESDEILGHNVRALFHDWPLSAPIVTAYRKDESSFLAEVTCEAGGDTSVITVRDIWGDEALDTIEELEHVGTFERDLIDSASRWSDEVFEIYGLPRRSRVPTFDEVRRFVVEEDRARFVGAVEESIRTHEPLRVQYRIRRGGGETRTLVATGKLVTDDAGRAIRLYGSVRDVTAELARDDLPRQLEEMRRVATLGRVAATMAHEFNNVMMGIITFVEVLKRHREPPAIDRAIRSIESGIKRGRTITDEILRYARASKPTLSTIDVTSWLSDFAAEAQAITGGAAAIETQEGLWIRGDVSQLNQVLVNLLLNARDASAPNSPIEIRVLRESEQFAEIVVADHGSGIRSDLLERIFDPLFTTKQRGTGLGLAVVRQVMDAHGGTVRVKSEVGAGTEFRLRLPMAKVREDRPAAGRSLLLVEDDAGVAAGLEVLLTSEHLKVRIASTGSEAIREIDRSRPDVIVLDLQLPDIAGASVYDEVAERWPGLPVIFISGSFDPHEVARHLQQPHAAFLYKPFELDQLLHAIARVAPVRE
jgi:signal transduction histidine kinase